MPFWAGIAAIAWKVLEMIGRWVLRRIAMIGRKRLLIYMRERVEVFQERHAVAKTKIRQAWLSGRIIRWNRAIEWIEENALRLSKRGAKKLYDYLRDKVDDHVSCEEYPEAA